MKNPITILVLAIGLAPALIAQPGHQPLWTAQERQLLLDGLQSTQMELMKAVDNLNEAQMLFKPDTNKWSVAEVLEHLGTFEEILLWDLYCNQFTPEQPGFTSNRLAKDSIMSAYAADTTKGKSPLAAVPLGRFTTRAALQKYFLHHRSAVMDLVAHTTADFRRHYIYRPSEWGDWAVRDLHQYTIVYIAHTTRHTDQINRIKADKNFPQNGKYWSAQDRDKLIKELERTKNELITQTEGLTPEQWHFKPSKDAWSIAQVVEHVGIYERIVLQEAWTATDLPPQPEYARDALPDSTYLSWMMEKQPHTAPENAIPLGLMKGKDNLLFYLHGRDLILDFVQKTDKDLKSHFVPRAGEPNNKRSVHGLFVVHYGHTDRHLRQIQKIKLYAGYPK
jgi:uncharacterized damage-inducible protein DinB